MSTSLTMFELVNDITGETIGHGFYRSHADARKAARAGRLPAYEIWQVEVFDDDLHYVRRVEHAVDEPRDIPEDTPCLDEPWWRQQ